MKSFLLILLIVIINQNIWSQDTSSVKLGEVSVRADSLQKKKYPNMIYHEFSEEEIQNFPYSDVGSLVNSISNVTLKDYGGVGGLKTISVRGFSSVHNGVLIGNLPILNSQTGAVDLGGMRTDNIYNLSFAIGSINDKFYPTRANSYVSTINIIPIEFKRDFKKVSFRVGGGFGSFSTIEPFLNLNFRLKKTVLGVNFRYLYSEGNYPYEMSLQGNPIEGKRENSRVRNYQINLGGISELRKGELSYRVSYEESDKQLPGAVILYDSSKSEQNLANLNVSSQLDYRFSNEKWSAYVFGKYDYNETHYRDPNFLNSTGGIQDQYFMNTFFGGATFSVSPIKRMELLFGADHSYTSLNSNKNTIQNTHRNDLKGMVGLNYSFWRIKIKANGLVSFIQDRNADQNNFETVKVNPFISFGIFPIKKSLFHIRLYYKNSLRAPTMNELYYNQIHQNVEPETAHQINLGMSYKKTDWTIFKYFHIGMDVYKNFVQNKIVLIPTQNLFVWSVTNVGKTDITGADINLSIKTNELKYMTFFWDFKYSVMIALDVTDPNSKTYKNQLPYIPQNNFTTLIGFEFFGFGLSWDINYGGERWSLAENIDANKLEDYFINDLSFYYNYKFKDGKNRLKIKVDVRNILNESYQMVRSFPMPGVNYNVKLIYEFNH